MKKMLLTMMVMSIVSVLSASAATEYKCVEPYDLNNKFVSATTIVTGYNHIVEEIAEKKIKKEFLKLADGSDVNIELKTYSPKDLENGIFKYLQITGEDIVANDIYLKSLDVKTLCDFNYVTENGKNNYEFKEELPMSFKITMNQYTINKSMESERYKKIINKLNSAASTCALGTEISSTKISIKNNKVYYVMGFKFPLISKEQKVVLQSDLKINDGKLDFSNTQIVSGKIALDLKFLDFMWNYLNPLDFSVKVLDNYDVNIITKEFDITDNEITAKGLLIIPKS